LITLNLTGILFTYLGKGANLPPKAGNFCGFPVSVP
jgi:hypothetical protein